MGVRKGFPIPIKDRLERKTERCGDCWCWTGCTDSDGYGRIVVGSRTDGSRRLEGVHRLSYMTFVGPIPEGMEIHHRCLTRNCWRPDHLEPLVHLANCAWDLRSLATQEKQRAWAQKLAKLGHAALQEKRLQDRMRDM